MRVVACSKEAQGGETVFVTCPVLPGLFVDLCTSCESVLGGEPVQ